VALVKTTKGLVGRHSGLPPPHHVTHPGAGTLSVGLGLTVELSGGNVTDSLVGGKQHSVRGHALIQVLVRRQLSEVFDDLLSDEMKFDVVLLRLPAQHLERPVSVHTVDEDQHALSLLDEGTVRRDCFEACRDLLFYDC
jgi:hypothetical protein